MSRFFFDIHDGEAQTRDEEGGEFANREAARVEGIAALAHLVRDTLPDGNRRDFIVDIRDKAGRLIFTATLSLVARWID